MQTDPRDGVGGAAMTTRHSDRCTSFQATEMMEMRYGVWESTSGRRAGMPLLSSPPFLGRASQARRLRLHRQKKKAVQLGASIVSWRSAKRR